MFEDRSIRRKRRFVLAAVFLLLAFAAFGVGYFFNAEAPEIMKDPDNPAKVNLQIPDSLLNPEEVKQPMNQVSADNNADQTISIPNKDLITPGTQLVFKVYFSSCRHTIEKTVQAAEDEVNMTEVQLAIKYSDWEIAAFIPPLVELGKTIDTYCPNHYIIGENNGYIAIYVYNENGQRLMQEMTDISIATLTPEDQQALNGGIIVDTEDQKEQTLEGFSN